MPWSPASPTARTSPCFAVRSTCLGRATSAPLVRLRSARSDLESARMRVGVLTGTGTYTLPGAGEGRIENVITVHGDVPVTRLEVSGVEVLHVSRHGEGHKRLSNHVAHRANILALKQLGAEAIAAVTVCGAVDPSVPLGSLIVFDDLHFLTNRLADGSVCTLHDEAGDPRRGHWIYQRPFAAGVREAPLAGSREAGPPPPDRAVCRARARPPLHTPRPNRSSHPR